MQFTNISDLPVVLNNVCFNIEESITIPVVDIHHPWVEELHSLEVMKSVIDLLISCVKENGDVDLIDLLTIVQSGHMNGDVSATHLALSDIFTSKINEFFVNIAAPNRKIFIDDFVEDFSPLYHQQEDYPIFKEVVSLFKEYIKLLVKYFNQDDSFINRFSYVVNPVNNISINVIPIPNIICGTYLKDYGLIPLLKSKGVGNKLISYFDKIRANNPDFEKLKRLDIYCNSINVFEKVSKYIIYITNEGYRIHRAYSY